MLRFRVFALLGRSRAFSTSKTLPNGSNLLNMPALSPTMTSGTISRWNLKVGEEFTPGSLLCEVETDKATVDFEAIDEGFLADILVKSGTSDIPVNSPIAIVAETKEALSAVQDLQFSLSDFIEPTEAPTPVVEAIPEKKPAQRRLSPAAGLVAKNLGVDLNAVAGTGKHGVVTKADVLLASGVVQQQEEVKPAVAAAEAVAENFEDVALTPMRRVISKRMVESKAKSAHSYMSIKCEVDAANELRQTFEKQFSLNDLVILASARALESLQSLLPEAQVSSVDIAVAVATKTGLITPIVKNASRRGLVEINTAVKELADRARAGKLAPEEYSGGSFTVSNLGMFGISNFTAVINQPQKAILAVGGSKKKLKRKGEWVSEMEVTLSFDRKSVKDKEAAEFLQAFRSYFSKPHLLLA